MSYLQENNDMNIRGPKCEMSVSSKPSLPVRQPNLLYYSAFQFPNKQIQEEYSTLKLLHIPRLNKNIPFLKIFLENLRRPPPAQPAPEGVPSVCLRFQN
jgi:hypothetical protein